MNRGAVFSPCLRYRFRLWRIWNASKPALCFVMLNPSTANETKNDPTVSRCQRRAEALGFGGVQVANIFALRSTDPQALYSFHIDGEVFDPDPIGPDNSRHIAEAALASGLVICAWGGHGKHMGRGAQVLNILRAVNVIPHALKINSDGTPAHPLYLPYSLQPKAIMQ